MMSKEQREKQNSYLRQWRVKNKEKVQEYNRRYAIKRALKALPTEAQRQEYLSKLEKKKNLSESERKAKRKIKDKKYLIRKGLALLQQEKNFNSGV